MPRQKNELLQEVADYYGEKLQVYGETAKGVDWNGEASQFAAVVNERGDAWRKGRK